MGMRPKLPSFLLVTTPERKPDPTDLHPGSGVILRHYGHPNRLSMGQTLAHHARIKRVTLLVAADLGLAVRLRAGGIHLPEGMMTVPLAPILGWARRNNRLITAACHSRLALNRARRLKVDAALLSPVFPTASHPGAKILGLPHFASLCKKVPIPIYGLGGMRRKTAALTLRHTNAVGVAATIPLKSKR